MKSYNEIKKALEQQHESTRYFTKSFLRIYVAACDMAQSNFDKGINDLYYDDNGILARRAYDAVRQTDFYKKNSCAYCVFLEIVA